MDNFIITILDFSSGRVLMLDFDSSEYSTDEEDIERFFCDNEIRMKDCEYMLTPKSEFSVHCSF